MEHTEFSETSAYKILTPGNYPEESRECLLSFCAESDVFHFVIKNQKDKHNYNFVFCFVWVRKLVAHIEGGAYAEGI